MLKKDKKQLIRICILLAIIAIVICIALNIKPKETTSKDTSQNNYIDTSDIEETTFNWEDVVDIQIVGNEGDLVSEITYKEIPELRSKIDKENAKWEKLRAELDPLEDGEEISAYLSWLEELNKLYSTDFCETPPDINTHVKGDTIKITCSSEILEKLNYKFNDGFEYTLTDIYEKINIIDDVETQDTESTEENSQFDNTEETKSENATTSENVPTNIDKNYYWQLGNDVFININDISSAKLNPAVSDEERIFLVVNNEEDFQTVKDYVTKHTENTYVIEYDGYWYGLNGNFEEKEICKGITLGN